MGEPLRWTGSPAYSKWRHGKDSPMPYAQSRRATVPLQTPGDGVSRRLPMNFIYYHRTNYELSNSVNNPIFC